MSQPRLRVAIQKSGRLSEQSRGLLEQCGIRFASSRDRLLCYGENMPVDLLRVRDDDIPGLLLQGSADLGIAGLNVLSEAELAAPDWPIAELMDLGFAGCTLKIAVPESMSYQAPEDLTGLRVATSYPALTRAFLERQGISATVVELTGSVEIAPALGSADVICDLVSTGATLRANHLRPVATVLDSTARLVSRPLEPAQQAIVDRLLPRLRGVLGVNESKYVMLHAPRSSLEQIRAVLPGAEAPTILPLEGSDRVAIHAVCRETVFWEHLEELKALGASAVLVLPVEKMLA